MLRKYMINGKEWQFEEGEQPAGAVEMTAAEKDIVPKPDAKAVEPKNKSRGVKKK